MYESELTDSSGGRIPELTSWDACIAALTSSRWTSDRALVRKATTPSDNLLAMDGHRHAELRRILAPFFSPERIGAGQEQLEALGLDLTDELHDEATLDLVEHLARPLVLAGLEQLLGVGAFESRRLASGLDQMIGVLEPDSSPQDVRRTGRGLAQVSAALRSTRKHGGSDLLSVLDAAVEERRISAAEGDVTAVVVAHGGYENPLNLLGNLIAMRAGSNPASQPDPMSRSGHFIDQVLTTRPPARRVLRFTTSALRTGDLTLEPGDACWIHLAAANAEQTRQPGGGVRSGPRHLSFGLGSHRCPGIALSHLLCRVCIGVLETLPPERLAACEVTWSERFISQGPSAIRF